MGWQPGLEASSASSLSAARAVRQQLREECGDAGGAGHVAQPQTQLALRMQQEAQQKMWRNGAAANGCTLPGRASRGIMPKKVVGLGNGHSVLDRSHDEEKPAEGGSTTQFMTKDDLAKMRHEMRESCRARQRDQARKRADMDGECPLFMSLRMRRMLEFVYGLPPSGFEAGPKSELLDTTALEDNVAKAIADLTFHHNFPPAYIQYFLNLQDVASLLRKPSLEPQVVYNALLDRMRQDLREDPPSGVDWTCLADGRMHDLVPAAVDMQAPEKRNSYGTAVVNNEDVVMHRKTDERGPPKAWFGSDNDVEQDTYQFKRVMDNVLPIAKHKEDILNMIRDNQIVLIQGETGCGKTTQVPQYILEAALKNKNETRRQVRIIVTQPRRIAAITVAKRVAEELGQKVGEGVVGYKIRGTTVASPDCKLLFCTTGVVLRRLANEGSKWMFSPKTVTHLLVDEVHERGVDTDFMLTFLKEVQAKRPNLRVVLMSATMDTECFLKYFSLQVAVMRPSGEEEIVETRPPMVICPAFCHPVVEVYLEGINSRLGRNLKVEGKSPDELKSGKDPNEMSESDGIDYDLIVKIIEEFEVTPDGAWTFDTGKVKARPKDPTKGAVLIFLPGLGEITQLMTKLTEESSFASKWWVLPLHANLPPEEQQTCFLTQLPAGCTRKIICSTNVAETSVTVPDVTVVIDSCRERRNQVDRYSNTPMLREQWCALDSLKQRRGRAGRVQPGVCFRILPEKYLERLDKISPPEMQRVPLENIYLQVCASGILDRPAFLAKTPDPPEEAAVLFAEVALSDLGALDNKTHDGLTPLGRHLASLPCHPRLGKILVLSCLLGVPGPGLSICAAMSVRNPMLTTQDNNKRAAWQAARTELTEQIGSRSDHCVWAYIMQEWRFGDMKQREFCRKLGISFERMCSAMFERKHLCESLVKVGLLPDSFLWNEWFDQDKVPDWSLVRAAVIGGLYPNIIHVERSVPRYQTNTPGEKAKYMRYSVLQRHYSKQESMSYPKSLNLHPGSLMFGQDQYHCPWLAFYTIQHTTKLYVYDATEVNPLALLIFGGDPVFNELNGHLEVGSWARFACKQGKRLLPIIQAARASVQKVLERKLDDLKFDLANCKELKVCTQLLRCSGLGYYAPMPGDIQREGGEKEADEFDEWENEVAHMMRKDEEHEKKMKDVWLAAKKAAE